MKRVWTLLIAAMLAACFLSATLCGAINVSAEEPPTLSYGIAGRENNTVLDGAALYEALFEESPTEGENAYFDVIGLTLSYNSAISAGCISTDYDKEAGTLLLTVRPYRYTAENGVEVVWLPTRATVEGTDVALTEADGAYTACMEGLFRSENFDMTVDYSWSVEIPATVLETARNGAYLVGSAALEEQAEYERAYAEYLRISADYVAWQTYLEKKLAYEAYTEALAAYNAQVAAYDAYVEAKTIYEREDAAYGEWQDYFVALSAYTEAYTKYTAYQSYLSGMETVEKKLLLPDCIFVYDSHSWGLYASIMGGNVSMVIDRREELINVLHCSEADVNLARDATEALRVLLKGYYDIRTATYSSEYERAQAKYEYYRKHYSALKVHFTNLYMTLKGFLDNTFVERALESEGQRDHYLQFVAQLYIVSTCLDSEGERRADWTIGGKRLEQVVEPLQILPDGDWDPRISAFPAYADPAECPVEPTAPTVDLPASKPTPPIPVDEPPQNAPTEVEDPDKGVIPPQCDESPAEEPTAPAFDDVTRLLMEEIEKGALNAHPKEVAPRTLRFETTLTRPVSILNEKLVTFYDIEGNMLRQELVSYGASLSYDPPEHAFSPAYEYRLLGWITAEGNEVDLKYITQDMDLYPNYEMTKKSYTVTWRIIGADGTVKEYSSVWTYGSTPAPGAQVPCTSYEENGYVYTFSGWDREILPVTEHTVYTGSVTKAPKKYPITWVIGEESVVELWEHGTLPIYTGDTSVTSSSASYTFLGWSPAVSVADGAATYTARYEIRYFATSGTAPLEVADEADAFCILATTHASVSIREMLTRASDAGRALRIRWSNGCELFLDSACVTRLSQTDCTLVVLQSTAEGESTFYELHFYNSLLKNVDIKDAVPVLYLPFETAEDGKSAAFFLSEAEGESRISLPTLQIKGATVVRRIYVYPMSVTPDPNCNTGALGYDAAPGALIDLGKLECLFGYEVTGAVVTDAAGNAIEIQNLSFVMPASAVTVTLRVEQIRYRVIFRVDGVVIFEREYGYGEAILLPDAPTKAAEGNTVYSFASWSGEVPTHATGQTREMIFDAIFTAQEKDIDYDTGHNNNLLAEVILPVVGGCMLLVGGVITLIVILRKRRR